MSTNHRIARANYAKIFAGLSVDERRALRDISNGALTVGPVRAIGRLNALALIKRDGKRIVLTENGRVVARLC